MGIKISDLPVASQSNTDDIFPVVQDNTTKQIQQSVLLQDVNNDITDLNNNIDRLDNRIDEAIAEFTYPLSYKGEVQTFQDLPSGATAGDIYTVISENKNYIWNGTEWIEYAAAIDFTNIENQIKTTLTTEQAEEHTIQNTAPVNGKIDVSGNSTQRLLPEEYQEVEYIGVTGTQYIDTGFKATNNTKISIDATVSNLDASGRFLFGARNAERTDTFAGLIWTDNKVSGGYGSGSIWESNVAQPINEKFNLTLDKNLLYHNNTLLKTFNTQTFTATNNIWIGALNNNGSISQAHHGNIYFCKIWDNETPVREYIPCYRKSDNVIGMYDLVSKTFFTNAGTGTFTKGNDVAGNYLVSPTYPVEIHNVGDNVNLFDDDYVTLAFNSLTIGQTTTLVSGANYRGAYVEVEEGKTYSVSKKVSPRFIIGFTKVVPASRS